MERVQSAARIESVKLIVNDLVTCVNYYRDAIGLKVLFEGSPTVLGVGETPLLILQENPSAARVKPTTGLYHVAFLLPTRADLARQLRHFIAQGVPLQGMSDHQVSEALYLSDPEGNGIEIYRDRLKEDWRWINGEVVMTTDPMDLDGVLATVDRADDPWEGMPKGTLIGHVHLRVSDLRVAEGFYRKVLGMDVTTHSYRGAIFLSLDGYHHHIGVNTWGSEGAPSRQKGAAGLDHFVLRLDNAIERQALKERIKLSSMTVSEQNSTMVITDPFGIEIHIRD